MVVIVWELDIQLPVQSVPITTKVVSSNVNVRKISLCFVKASVVNLIINVLMFIVMKQISFLFNRIAGVMVRMLA